MIPVTAAKWITRVFSILALGLFAAMFAYAFTRSGPTSIGPDGSTTTAISDAEMGVLGTLMSCTAWSICAAVGVRTLASSVSPVRAVISLGQPLGLALAFAGPMLWTSASHSSMVPLLVAGVLLVLVSKIIDFAFFGAREALSAVEGGIAEIRDAMAERSHPSSGPAADPAPASSPQITFRPEPLVGEYPPPDVGLNGR